MLVVSGALTSIDWQIEAKNRGEIHVIANTSFRETLVGSPLHSETFIPKKLVKNERGNLDGQHYSCVDLR